VPGDNVGRDQGGIESRLQLVEWSPNRNRWNKGQSDESSQV